MTSRVGKMTSRVGKMTSRVEGEMGNIQQGGEVLSLTAALVQQ